MFSGKCAAPAPCHLLTALLVTSVCVLPLQVFTKQHQIVQLLDAEVEAQVVGCSEPLLSQADSALQDQQQ